MKNDMLNYVWPCAVAVLIASAAYAQTTNIPFPALDKMELYATIERGPVTERALTTRDVIDAVKSGQPIPTSSQVVLEIYRSGALDKTFVMRKGSGEEHRGWDFISFESDQSISAGRSESPERCASCHQSRETEDYLYLRDRMVSFE